MSLVPCGHRILVRPYKLEDVDQTIAASKKLGIYIPEATERLQQATVDKGTVLEIGPTAYKDFGGDPWCKKGDLVAYAKYGGKLITDPETQEDLLILNDEDIIAVLKGKHNE